MINTATKIINETHPLGNRLTRRSNDAFNRKVNKQKNPSTSIVRRRLNGKSVLVKVNNKCVQTKGAFGKGPKY